MRPKRDTTRFEQGNFAVHKRSRAPSSPQCSCPDPLYRGPTVRWPNAESMRALLRRSWRRLPFVSCMVLAVGLYRRSPALSGARRAWPVSG
jgi:hypothetical protein